MTPLPRLGRLLLAAALAQTLAPAAAAAQTTTEYLVMTSGQRSGEMTVRADGARREVTYRYNDRGRGPDTRSNVTLDARLAPSALSVDGVDYMKLAVAERFERKGGKASWKAANDGGATPAPGFYVPDELNPEHLAMLARALLRAPGQELPLLPAGKARIERLAQRQETLDGVQRTLSLYAITGLQFGPTTLWLDEKNELVVEGAGWVLTVRKDAQGALERLVADQTAALDARDLARAAGLGRRPDGAVAFRSVALFDPQSRSLRPDTTVLVEGGRITAVGPSAQVAVPAGAEVIDGRGKTLLPGLWDMHVHILGNYEGMLHLAAGVTATRDLGNTPDEIELRARRYDAGELVGPRVVRAGFIDGPGPLSGPIKVLAGTPDEVRAQIRKYAEHGVAQIKLYSSFDTRLVPVAAEEAHRLGLKLSGHVPAGMTMRDAVAAGYDEVNHLNFAALNFMGPEINAKTNGITRITAIAEHAWELDPADQRTADFIAFLKSRGTTVDPTFLLYEDHLKGRPGQAAPTLVKVIDRLPPVIRRAYYGAGLARTPQEVERNARSFERMQQLLKALHDGGVPIVPGTDTLAGFSLHRELELYAEAGIPTGDVLYMATLGSARAVRQEARLGSVEPGKLADMILVDGDPMARIEDIRKVSLVMKDGRFFQPERLLSEVGVAPAAR